MKVGESLDEEGSGFGDSGGVPYCEADGEYCEAVGEYHRRCIGFLICGDRTLSLG